MFSERTGIQPFLTLLVIVGLVRTCKDRQYLWLTAAFLFAFASWFIGVTTEGALKHLLAGFWYTDYYRTGAMAALFAIPLAAMGFAWLFEGLKAQLEKRLGGVRRNTCCFHLRCSIARTDACCSVLPPAYQGGR